MKEANARWTRLGDDQYGPRPVGGETRRFSTRRVFAVRQRTRKMPSPQNVRRLVLTAAVTSITIAGTLYGAGLKTNEEITEVSRMLLAEDQPSPRNAILT